MWGEKYPMYYWWQWKLATRKNSMELKKLKTELPYGPAILLLGIYPKEMKTVSQRSICTPIFAAVLFTIAKTCKQPKCPTMDEWIKKMWHIYPMEYYLDVRKKEILPFATTQMNLKVITLSEISQSEKWILYHLHVESIKAELIEAKWWLPGDG